MIWIIFIKILKNTNQTENVKYLIVFDDMIADMLTNKKLNSVVTELFIRKRKFNISPLFITKSYFVVPKNIRLYSTNYIIMKIPDHLVIHQVMSLRTL